MQKRETEKRGTQCTSVSVRKEGLKKTSVAAVREKESEKGSQEGETDIQMEAERRQKRKSMTKKDSRFSK